MMKSAYLAAALLIPSLFTPWSIAGTRSAALRTTSQLTIESRRPPQPAPIRRVRDQRTWSFDHFPSAKVEPAYEMQISTTNPTQSLPGIKTPSPTPGASPFATEQPMVDQSQSAPAQQIDPNMPGSKMGPMKTVGPMIMSGDQMAVRIGGRDSRFMFIGQMGSGTSWQPASTPTYMIDKTEAGWMLMFHFNLFAGLDHQGGPRGVTRFDSSNWFMVEGFHRAGKGTLELRGMFSAEPFSFARGGSPILFQTGETYKGRPIIDRQHPHELFMELSAQYTLPLGERGTWFAYLGYPGEPALGPASFMHRASASENPGAPLAHHLQDSTHVSFGVFTAGFTYRWLKLEGSVFNGREPDENRYDLEAHRWDSGSVRLSYAPNRNWTMQISQGFLRNPEVLDPGTTRRTTASVSYNRSFAHGSWATSLIWGRNHESHRDAEIFNLNGYTAESTLNFRDRNHVYLRLELVDKNELLRPADRLKLGIAQNHPSFRIGAYTVGLVRDVWTTKKISLGLGGDFTAYSKPAALDPIYGNRPTSYRLFLRLRPNRMKMPEALAHNSDERMSSIPASPASVVAGNDNSPAHDFALTDQDGKAFHLSQLRGKAVLLFFGYTHCPDACPTTMAKLSRVYKALGGDADRVVTLFVSVDPDRDTTSVLKSYLAYFHMNAIGLTGTKTEIDAVVKRYGARYEIQQSDSAAGYHINHSTDLYLLNKKGELARTFAYGAGTQEIADGVNQVIRRTFACSSNPSILKEYPSC